MSPVNFISSPARLARLFSGLGYARKDRSRRSGPQPRRQEGRCRIVAHRSDEVKVVKSRLSASLPAGPLTQSLQPPPGRLTKMVLFYLRAMERIPLLGVVRGA